MGCGASGPKDPNTVWLDHFDVHRVVGEGGFGKVNAVQRLSDNKWFAMKTLSKSKVLIKRNVPMVYNERDILARIPINPWVVNLHYCFQDEVSLYVIMDIAVGGDLRYRVNHAPGKKLEVSEVLFYSLCCFFGLEYLHGVQVVHRDIKPDNLLIDEEGYALVTDMGVSKILKDGFVSGRSGTGSYLAPEVFIPPEHLHNEAVDVYAMGVTVYELIVGRKPFDKATVRAYGKLLARTYSVDGRASGVIPSLPRDEKQEQEISPETTTKSTADKLEELERLKMQLEVIESKFDDPDVCDLVKGMLNLDYRKRLTIPQIFKHPAYKDFDVEAIRNRTIKPKFVPDKTKAYCEVNKDDVANLLGGDDVGSRKSFKTSESFKADTYGDDPFASFDYNTKLDAPQAKQGKATVVPAPEK